MEKRITHIAMAGDRNILLGMAVTGRSALEYTTSPIIFEILCTGFTEKDKRALIRSWEHPQNAGVNFYDIHTKEIKNYRSTMYLKSKSAYSRYFIGRIPNVDRLIYLDTDMIVTKDVSIANDINLLGKCIAAVPDVSVRLDTNHTRITDVLGIRDSNSYFNSGFIIIDVKKWNLLNSEDNLTRISTEMFNVLDCQDQDALNIFFEKNVHVLDVSWNTSQYEAGDKVCNIILHLIGTIKPWQPGYDYRFKDLFNNWLDKTAYANQRPANNNSFSAIMTRFNRKIPTLGMFINKIRRTFAKL